MRLLPVFLFMGLVSHSLIGQTITSYELSAFSSELFPNSNSSSVIAVFQNTFWFGTSRGLSITEDGGRTWKNFAKQATFDNKGISAIAIRGDTIWVSTAYSEKRDGATIPVGGGLHRSFDHGKSWTYFPQPVDTGKVDTLIYGLNKIRALAVTVPQQNVTYDIELTKGTIWIASFAGMLRKSTDNGKTWHRVILPPDGSIDTISPKDTLNFDLSPSSGAIGLRENLNHRVFSVFASSDSTIWVGTAGGINKSTDGGISWRKYTHQNQVKSISGNFVVALNKQRWQSRELIWAATVNASDKNEQQGVSFTEDGGESWTRTLLGERAHNFSFRDSIVYVATNNGLFRSLDFGRTWQRNGIISDPSNRQQFTTSAIYAVTCKGDTVWIAGSDGIAYTIESSGKPFASEWKIFRTHQQVGTTNQTYAFPTPFSPDDEVVRIHYSTAGRDVPVTIRIFDFTMHPLRTVIQNAHRTGTIEHDEIWDGKNEFGKKVSNGIYFYRIEIDGASEMWGKIFVLQ